MVAVLFLSQRSHTKNICHIYFLAPFFYNVIVELPSLAKPIVAIGWKGEKMDSAFFAPTHPIKPTALSFGRGEAPTLYSVGKIEIALITNGVGTLEVAGDQVPCKENDLFLLYPDLLHGFHTSEECAQMTVRRLCFDPAVWLMGEAASYTSPRFCYGAFSDGTAIASAVLTNKAMARVQRFFDEIEKECERAREEWQAAVGATLSLLLIDVGRYVKNAIKRVPTLPQKEWSVASAALRAAERQYADSTLTLELIADQLFISRSHLSTLIKRLTGVGFSDHLRGIRLEHACRLLSETELSVAEIMEACGLRDTPSFYRNFNAHTGMTPHQYRTANTKDDKKKQKGELIMSILNEICENLQKGKAKIVKEMVAKALEEGCAPADILNEGLLSGMSIIGEKFKNNEVYVPEVLVAARAMNMGTQVLKPYLAAEGVAAKGKVCIGTVQGDLHDIGKNLVKMMMEGKGLEVIDLGTDVAPEAFIETAINENCQVICCSALLTTTMSVMADVVKAAEAAGIRDKVKIMIGGAPVNEDFRREIGADCYTVDAASAADAAVALCKN